MPIKYRSEAFMGCEAHREENSPLLAAHLEELATLGPSLITHEHQEQKQEGPGQPSFLFCNTPERYRPPSILPDTGNPNDLFSTRTPKTLYDTRVNARHQCPGANERQVMKGKDTRAYTVQDNERSKELPVGEEVPRSQRTFPR